MANQLHGHGSSYGGPGLYASHLGSADPYPSGLSLIRSLWYLNTDAVPAVESAKNFAPEWSSSSLYVSRSGGLGPPETEGGGVGSHPHGKVSGGIGGAASTPSFYMQSAASADSSLPNGMKRPFGALYHETIMGNQNSIGQSEALIYANSLVKRPRNEIASHLPIYPQRPTEKDCSYYMLTRTCKFGDNCKFNHPLWVPEGGIPDWKEVPLITTAECLPERPGEPDCPYFMKTQICKFGLRCKFNHPKKEVSETDDTSRLPERPYEPICSFYVKTGKCKFGANCIYHHPKDNKIQSNGQGPASEKLTESTGKDVTADDDSKPMKKFSPFTPALTHNSKGLPVRLGEQDCPFYLKTGSCKYGSLCRYNHPDRNAMNLPTAAAALDHAIISSSASNLPIGVINAAASFLANINPHFTQMTLGVSPTSYPQRPGQIECDFYMKTGNCKFGERCKFHHPIDRSATTPMVNQAVQENVKLTLAGLPRREGSTFCPYYMKTGTCKYGPSCRYDHPTPAEAVARASAHGSTFASGATAAAEEEDAV